MDKLIEIVNQLQDVFDKSGASEQGLELPQVLVVGAQSSGKSSVLEHLVGKSFLPRGSGLVTRCPLRLQMLHCSESNQLQEYVVFNHNPTKVFTDYDLIRKEIEKQTEILAGTNKGICDIPIVLKLYSSSFLNLTLIDLPGVTKVPVGDQPLDIEEQTRDLILKYARNPNSIILAVSPANVDLATSESLKLAREVDPTGERTLAVITKLDLMDNGTDAKEMLNGKIIPVKLGIIGVVNRSQKDIIENKSVEQSLKDEDAFFYQKYKEIASSHGTKCLNKSVQSILISHIHSCFPELKERIRQKLEQADTELKRLADEDTDRQSNLLKLITSFSLSFCSVIKGDTVELNTTELCGGARINYVFQEWLGKSLNCIDPLEGLSKSAILIAIKNALGTKPYLFVPEVVVDKLANQQLMRLLSPCIQCVDLVFNEMIRIVQTCVENPNLGLRTYPKLHKELSDFVANIIHNRVPVTKDMINHLLGAQLDYINTSHPDLLPIILHQLLLFDDMVRVLQAFIDTPYLNYKKHLEIREQWFNVVDEIKRSSVPVTKDVINHFLGTQLDYYNTNNFEFLSLHKLLLEFSDKQLRSKLSQTIKGRDQILQEVLGSFKMSQGALYFGTSEGKDNRDFILILLIIRSYYFIVKKVIQDQVPKLIMHYLVKFIMEELHDKLVEKFYKNGDDDLMKQTSDVMERRRKLQEEVAALQEAITILNKL